MNVPQLAEMTQMPKSAPCNAYQSANSNKPSEELVSERSPEFSGLKVFGIKPQHHISFDTSRIGI